MDRYTLSLVKATFISKNEAEQKNILSTDS